MLWLVEEIGELAEAIRSEEPENIEEELADCFAWIAALANLYGVNLEEAFLKSTLACALLANRSPVSVRNEYCKHILFEEPDFQKPNFQNLFSGS